MKKIICFFILLTAMFKFQARAQTIAEPDRTILMNLYNSTGGDNWTKKNNWGTDTYPWDNVTVDAAGRVTKLSMNYNNLVGTLPDISGLTNIESIILTSNSISGPIPQLSTLTRLSYFDVTGNQLTGSIPSLTGLTNLQTFNCGFNQLSGTLPSLTGLVNLQYFHCYYNQLTGSVPSFAGLTSLTYFNCNNNQLDGTIPTDFNQATNIVQFQCRDNKLTGSLPDFTGLSKLHTFLCDGNNLTGSIPTLSGVGLTALNEFNVGNNMLSGNIPSITGLNNLQWFYCYTNQLTGFEPFVKPTRLSDWRIYMNSINFNSFDNITDPTTRDAFINSHAIGYSPQYVEITISKSGNNFTTDLAEGSTPANYTYHWYKINPDGSKQEVVTKVGQNTVPADELAAAGVTSLDSIFVQAYHNTYTITEDGWKDLIFSSNTYYYSLAVTFGTFNALIKNGQLIINWQTLSETNNDHFIVEISKDGKTFTKLSEVKSKAVGGNSTHAIEYTYTGNTAADIFALSALLALGFAGFGRRKKLLLGLVVLVMLAVGYSCSKKDVPVSNTTEGKIYVRIAQTDKDGTIRYSKIIQAISK